jgi:hypothetical protein
MPRGPKPKTAMNSSRSQKGFIRLAQIKPTSELSEVALAEFKRLIVVLDSTGALQRVDLAIPTESARIKAMLDDHYASCNGEYDSKVVSAIAQLVNVQKGLWRQMGICTQPSRVMHQAKPAYRDSSGIAQFIRIPGSPGWEDRDA